MAEKLKTSGKISLYEFRHNLGLLLDSRYAAMGLQLCHIEKEYNYWFKEPVTFEKLETHEGSWAGLFKHETLLKDRFFVITKNSSLYVRSNPDKLTEEIAELFTFASYKKLLQWRRLRKKSVSTESGSGATRNVSNVGTEAQQHTATASSQTEFYPTKLFDAETQTGTDLQTADASSQTAVTNLTEVQTQTAIVKIAEAQTQKFLHKPRLVEAYSQSENPAPLVESHTQTDHGIQIGSQTVQRSFENVGSQSETRHETFIGQMASRQALNEDKKIILKEACVYAPEQLQQNFHEITDDSQLQLAAHPAAPEAVHLIEAPQNESRGECGADNDPKSKQSELINESSSSTGLIEEEIRQMFELSSPTLNEYSQPSIQMEEPRTPPKRQRSMSGLNPFIVPAKFPKPATDYLYSDASVTCEDMSHLYQRRPSFSNKLVGMDATVVEYQAQLRSRWDKEPSTESIPESDDQDSMSVEREPRRRSISLKMMNISDLLLQQIDNLMKEIIAPKRLRGSSVKSMKKSKWVVYPVQNHGIGIYLSDNDGTPWYWNGDMWDPDMQIPHPGSHLPLKLPPRSLFYGEFIVIHPKDFGDSFVEFNIIDTGVWLGTVLAMAFHERSRLVKTYLDAQRDAKWVPKMFVNVKPYDDLRFVHKMLSRCYKKKGRNYVNRTRNYLQVNGFGLMEIFPSARAGAGNLDKNEFQYSMNRRYILDIPKSSTCLQKEGLKELSKVFTDL